MEIKRTTQISWRKFLATEAGMEGMLFLRSRIPNITKGDADGIIFDAGRVQGFKDSFDGISEVLGVVEAPVQDLENK